MYIFVSVVTKAKKDQIIKLSDFKFKVLVKAKAQRNEANLAVINLLANFLDLKPKQLHLIKGQHHSHKLFQILDH